jgi:signal transduction histidine kinase
MRLDDQHWLNALSIARDREPFWQWQMGLSLAVTALSLSLLLILALSRITRPLAALAGAAERFGRGEAIAELPESGPADIRDTIHAFNQMRERLERFVKDRTRMLAAISHDLRTPIAALRIRAELIDDNDTRERILNTLEEMQRMVEATLAFVREESSEEDTRSVDIAALLESICDDMSDLGTDVSFSGPGKTPYRCRPLALKRALQNLLENAVSYGLRARVALSVTADQLNIVIDDNGPGISEQDRERIFEPFVRLESSRNRETGGVGLGLSIARSIIRSHGGDIMLNNRVEGGLRVSVQLPRA